MRSARAAGVVLAVAGFGVWGCEPSTGPEPVATVVVAPNAITMASGADTNLTASVLGPSGAPIDGREVTWQSNDPTVVSVTGAGAATATFVLGSIPRFTTVTASSGGRTGQSVVTVLPSPADTLTLTPLGDALADGDVVQVLARIADAFGNQLTGRFISWVSRDTATLRVTAQGVVTPVPFLGTDSRDAVLVATAEGRSDSITVTVLPTTIERIEVVPGNAYLQPGWTKQLRVEGITTEGSRVTGLSPTWQTLDAGVVTVNGSGLATAQGLGSGAIVAEVSGLLDTLPVSVNACGNSPPGEYALEVRFVGPAPKASVQAAFDCAVARLSGIIRGELSSVSFSQSISECVNGVTLTETVNGLLIIARIDSIDGPGQVLGSAGPCYIRQSNSLPLVGRMVFDSADISGLESQGLLNSVILHEMLHVIGVGTVWSTLNLLQGVSAGTPTFLGSLAREACVSDHGGVNACATAVPVEDCRNLGSQPCGAGTINSHWKESIFATELMSGFLNTGLNPFSRMTIQSLADMGYGVDNTQDNEYNIPAGQALRAHGSDASSGLLMPEPFRPIGVVDNFGRVTLLPRY